jgi:pimeloyl-ACP methyl ester carboxylesterase
MKAPTLVLVPGLDGTAQLFYRQIPRLAREFDVIAFPLPDDPRCTMDSLVEALRSRIAEHASGDVFLCGESFGGALGLSFALAHPERLRGLITLNTFPVIRSPRMLRVAPPLLRLVPWGAMPVVRRFTERRLHTRHTRPEDLREFRQRTREIGRAGYIRRLEILRTYDIRERLHELEVPTLFLAGSEDRLVPSAAEARFMGERAPRASVRILEGYGHVCLIHHEFDLLEQVRPWLDEQAPRRAQRAEGERSQDLGRIQTKPRA